MKAVLGLDKAWNFIALDRPVFRILGLYQAKLIVIFENKIKPTPGMNIKPNKAKPFFKN